MNQSLKGRQEERGRVIIFSGVFDPVHIGHLSVAKKALEAEGKLVVFLPEKTPHRTLKKIGKSRRKSNCSPIRHRVAMLKLATASEKRFVIFESPFDHHLIKETLGWLQTQFPKDQNFGLLFGTDVAEHFEKWPDVERLSEFGIDEIVFANRVTNSDSEVGVPKIEGVRIKTLKAENNHLTSTLIRQNPKNRASALPPGVLNYIEDHKLFGSALSADSK